MLGYSGMAGMKASMNMPASVAYGLDPFLQESFATIRGRTLSNTRSDASLRSSKRGWLLLKG